MATLDAKGELLFRQQLRAALDAIDAAIAAVLPDGDKGDITVSSGTWTIDNNAVTTAKINDGAVTFGKLDGAAVITSGETIRSNDNDTSVPTSAAVIDIVGPQLQTAVAAAGQTSIDFTGIPAWVNRITVIMEGFSSSGTSPFLVRLGDSGGIEATGYTSTILGSSGAVVAHASETTGFYLAVPLAAANTISGRCTISRLSGNTWVSDAVMKRTTSGLTIAAGDKTLSDELTQLRITTAGGTDTFDAGSVNISWE